MKSTLRAAVDIGGTFTDVQIVDPATGAVWDHKTPSTPEDPSIGLIAGLKEAVEKNGHALGDLAMILHGSTIATNAVLERKLPDGGLITTAGFADVLGIGRHMRRDVYGLMAEPRPVLIPADRRTGVVERMRADGSVETPLDRDAVRRAGEALADQGVHAVAVAFLHAYRNPVHEQEAAEILSAIPGLTVATSHEASPEIREYERMSTTVLNALLKPVISRYLERVEAALADAEISARLFLVQSNGGVATPEEAARLPVRLLLSGPSGGAMAVRSLARRHAFDNVVGMDMGGTSTDVSVLQNGRIEETAGGEIDGLPVRLPMVEIRTIGAGGGSLARSEAGALRVGPESAGAMPGPACYLRGGTRPTVTDANLVLGLIAADRFLDGGMRLGTEEATAAVASVGAPLGLADPDMARGIVTVANAAMADAVRLSLFEKGADPQDFVLAAFGGAGGLHACAVAEALDIRQILFPATASTLSAHGILDSDIRHDLIEARLLIAETAAIPDLAAMLDALFERGTGALTADGLSSRNQQIEFAADMRYRGQAWEITVPWPEAENGASPSTLDALTASFHAEHFARYAHSAPGEAVEIVALRARAIGALDRIGRSDLTPDVRTAAPDSRRIYTQDGWTDVSVRPRDTMPLTEVDGPLLIEEAYSSLWIHPGWSVRAMPGGDLLATRKVSRS